MNPTVARSRAEKSLGHPAAWWQQRQTREETDGRDNSSCRFTWHFVLGGQLGHSEPTKHLSPTKSCPFSLFLFCHFFLTSFTYLPHPPLPLSSTSVSNQLILHFSRLSKACTALHSLIQLKKSVSPDSFNAIFFNLILLCFFLDPFHCRNSFSLLSLSFSTKTTFSLSISGHSLFQPEASQSSGNCCLPLKGVKRDVSICTTQLLFQTNSSAALIAASRGIISHLTAVNGFLF